MPTMLQELRQITDHMNKIDQEMIKYQDKVEEALKIEKSPPGNVLAPSYHDEGGSNGKRAGATGLKQAQVTDHDEECGRNIDFLFIAGKSDETPSDRCNVFPSAMREADKTIDNLESYVKNQTTAPIMALRSKVENESKELAERWEELKNIERIVKLRSMTKRLGELKGSLGKKSRKPEVQVPATPKESLDKKGRKAEVQVPASP